MKRVSVSWPRICGVVVPCGITETWPCALMVKPEEFCGIVMAGIHDIALRGDDAAGGVHLERAVARIGVGAVGQLNLEEAVAADRDVERAAGLRQRALRHQPRRADRLDAGAEIDADGEDIALRRGLRADPADVVVKQILELGALAFVAGGGHVGEVVGDDLDVELHRHHAGGCSTERAHRFNSPSTSIRNFSELVESPSGRDRPAAATWRRSGCRRA